jgi:predicted Fe-Mo cluster-binding NifX family protein
MSALALALALPRPGVRIGVLVMGPESAAALCPFFGKCDGLLVIDQADNIREFYPNEGRTADSLCDLIVKSAANQLICGFIPEAAKHRLRAAGIHVRLGMCTRSVDELAQCACQLPEA